MYALIKFFHILGAVLFLGNIIVTAVWKVLADRTGDPPVVAYAQHLVTRTDQYFTGPGAILILLSGFHMALSGGRALFHATWVMWGAGLFGVSGLLWALVLLPTQKKQAALSRDFANSGEIPAAYWHLSRRWALWGGITTVLAMGTLVLMVLRPM